MESDRKEHLPILLTGTWEKRDRSPVTAAVIVLLVGGWLYFVVQTLFTVVGILIQLLFTDTALSSLDGDLIGANSLQTFKGVFLLAIALSQYVVLLGIPILIIRKWHTPLVHSYVRFQVSKPIKTTYEILFAMVGTILIMPLTSYFEYFFGRYLDDLPDSIFEDQMQLFIAGNGGELFLIIFVVAFTPAICEEFFFRGYLQRTLERKVGWWSVLIVALVFGLFHFNPFGLLTLSVIGGFIGYLYYRSRSLIPGMVAHFTNNFIVIILLNYQPVLAGENLLHMAYAPLAWTVVSFVLFVLLLLGYEQYILPRYHD